MPPPRLAFVGATHAVSPWLLRTLGRLGTFEAVCGEDAERGAALHHARWTFSDPEALLRETEPSGVVVALPVRERLGVIKQCLAGGAGVLVVGSPGPVSAIKRLALLASLSGRAVLATPAIRHAPSILLAKRLIDSGQAGPPVSMTLHSTRRGAPRGDPDDDGPVPADQVFEAVDLVQHLVGPLTWVSAVAQSDAGVLVFSGVTSSDVPVSMVLHSSGPAEAVGIDLEIRSSEGSRLRIDGSCRLTCGNGSRIDAAHRPRLASAEPAVELGYEGLVADFVRVLGLGRNSPELVGLVAEAVAATEAIFASAARRRPVVPKTADSPHASPGAAEARVGGA